VVLGLGKSVGFGALIAFVACHFRPAWSKPDTDSLAAAPRLRLWSSITAVFMLDCAWWPCSFSDVGF
jgi:phospholipid/cholesterol/gamma-HCH transport system permease protein